MVRACYGVWLIVLAVLYYALPGLHVVTWALIGLSGAAAIVAGVRMHRPSRSLPWYLIAVALVLFVSGDTIGYARTALGLNALFRGPSDLLYLSVYPLLAAALTLFLRARSGDGNRSALFDALIPTVSLGLLSWVYLIAPYTRATDLTVLEKAVSAAYPLGDVLALAMMLRLLTTAGRTA